MLTSLPDSITSIYNGGNQEVVQNPNSVSILNGFFKFQRELSMKRRSQFAALLIIVSIQYRYQNVGALHVTPAGEWQN